MKLMDWLKWALPKPQLPQKRYIVAFFIAAYPLLHLYVEHTQTDIDNKVLEAGKGIILEYFADAENKPNPSDDYDKDGLKYGEGYA